MMPKNTRHTNSPSAWSISLLGAAAAALALALGAGCAPPPEPAVAATPEATEASVLDLYTQSCNAGDADGCANAARVLMKPSSPHHDDVAALQFRTKACDAKPYYCGDLGQMYLTGKGVQKDEARGLTFLDKGCAAKNASACSTATLAHNSSAKTDDAPKAAVAVAAPPPPAPAPEVVAPVAAPVAQPVVATKQVNKKPAKKGTSAAKAVKPAN